MGWAKYYEDNTEITYERQEIMQSRNQESEIKTIRITILPTTGVTVRIEEESLDCTQAEVKDKYIVCKDCGRKFLFSAKAQKHYDRMCWDIPKRCKGCRSYRKTRFLMSSSF